MGDCTDCSMTVLKEHYEEARNILMANFYKGYIHDIEHTQFAHIYYSGINYGNLKCDKELIAAGIPFTWYWGNGSEYGAGEQYCRFTETGELILKKIYEKDADRISLSTLIKKLNNYEDLRECILQFERDQQVLPWDNQIEYGKLYKLKQLISTT